MEACCLRLQQGKRLRGSMPIGAVRRRPWFWGDACLTRPLCSSALTLCQQTWWEALPAWRPLPASCTTCGPWAPAPVRGFGSTTRRCVDTGASCFGNKETSAQKPGVRVSYSDDGSLPVPAEERQREPGCSQEGRQLQGARSLRCGAAGRSNGIVQSLRPSRHAPTQAASLSGQSWTGQPGSGPPSARPPPSSRPAPGRSAWTSSARPALEPPPAAAVVWMFLSADPVAPRKVQRPQRDPVDAQATQKLKQK
ncbi:uncharacterized protein LOC123651298 [Pipistrellus kuhlii]|uniref:Uncharacterized protein n=1 Tax=Pipistrellus kuhlii TaxID=59472 RepID=A0A7J7S6M2_PIPKU|nr:uncharacterized protein LOC123651298 [Pipistrellus kuhlii]KAF6283999.1 hypothetical protein mPipKuh1_010020 [Pipistrellus kuhlii]